MKIRKLITQSDQYGNPLPVSTKSNIESPNLKLNPSSKPTTEETYTSEGPDTPSHEYRQYPRRWPIIIFFATALLGGGIQMMGYGSIVPTMKEVYGVNNSIAQFLVLVYIIQSIPLTFPASKLVDSNIVYPTYLAVACFIGGAWIRLLIGTGGGGFYWLIIG